MEGMINAISIHPQLYASRTQRKQPAFSGNWAVETLTHTNIGSCMEGYIGKIHARKADGSECYLNVFKRFLGENAENYAIKNDKNEIIGEADIVIRKYQPNSYNSFEQLSDPSHVYVDKLRNYSKPDTPYYKQGLEYVKDIGTRLLQIAQRRSDESACCGNIKLTAKNESKQWYKNVIGMVEEFPQENYNFKFRINNPNKMILPPHSKEPLSRLQGGL